MDGSKRFEYRTKVAQRDIKSILVYCTYPTMRVVAKVKIKQVLCDAPASLWERTKDFSGISKEGFDKYFADKQVAYAYELGKIIQYKKPRELAYYGIRFAPQSFVYIK